MSSRGSNGNAILAVEILTEVMSKRYIPPSTPVSLLVELVRGGGTDGRVDGREGERERGRKPIECSLVGELLASCIA